MHRCMAMIEYNQFPHQNDLNSHNHHYRHILLGCIACLGTAIPFHYSLQEELPVFTRQKAVWALYYQRNILTFDELQFISSEKSMQSSSPSQYREYFKHRPLLQ